ncbi:hypothetical protein HUG10_15630 [Halorarum halophilum]|uniref:Uncharacterized protein n=1 Tax=Halorarum halophilum TaxID=2743090 RepID=A0A7D5L2X8_9EURY|nr:hypothetical protein [Halobaculum halophilum]QLG28883.1 hypothetical protein HUG10_15630 [Halobaculum halophilum]
MTILGMPDAMFLVFVATLLAGSLGAMHYVVVHVLLGKPVNDLAADRAAEGGDSTKDRATDGGQIDGGN